MFNSLFSDPLELLYRLPAVLVALAFHEWGHAYAAYRLGDPTARNLGRMTVDPFKHIDLMGFIMMILFRFGWAKPVPINPNNFKNPRRDEIIVSLAGVTVNFLLAFVTMGIVLSISFFTQIENEAYSKIMSNFFFINLALMVFNLIPVPPLDGYHVLKNLLIRKVNLKFFWSIERYSYLILIALLLLPATSNFLTFAVSGIVSGFSAIYSAIFSLFL